MLINILKILLPVLFVDIFFICYKFYCKILLKRYEKTEESLIAEGLEVDHITLEKVMDNKIIILFIISTILGIVSSFFLEIYDSLSVFELIQTEFIVIWFIFLMFISFYSIIKKVIYFISYSKGFLSGLNSINDESDSSSEED